MIATLTIAINHASLEEFAILEKTGASIRSIRVSGQDISTWPVGRISLAGEIYCAYNKAEELAAVIKAVNEVSVL